MSEPDSLLPPNATAFETAAARVFARVSDVPVELEAMRIPAEMPLSLLPWIAYGLVVPEWDPAWLEATKRAVIANAIPTHKIKGTRGAVEAALSTVGVPVTIVEWWEDSPAATPGTFTVNVRLDSPSLDGEPVFTSARARQIRRVVDRTKRESQHYTFDLGADTGSDSGAAVAACLRRRITIKGIVE